MPSRWKGYFCEPSINGFCQVEKNIIQSLIHTIGSYFIKIGAILLNTYKVYDKALFYLGFLR